MKMKSFSIELPEDALKQLDRFAFEEGLTKWRIVLAGVQVFELLPLAIRQMALKGEFEGLARVFGEYDFRMSLRKMIDDYPGGIDALTESLASEDTVVEHARETVREAQRRGRRRTQKGQRDSKAG